MNVVLSTCYFTKKVGPSPRLMYSLLYAHLSKLFSIQSYSKVKIQVKWKRGHPYRYLLFYSTPSLKLTLNTRNPSRMPFKYLES